MISFRKSNSSTSAEKMNKNLKAVVPFGDYLVLESHDQLDRYEKWLEEQSHAISVFEKYLKKNKLVHRSDTISGHLIRLLAFLPLKMTEDAEELEWVQQKIRVRLFKKCTGIKERADIDVFLNSFLDKFCVKSKNALLAEKPFGSTHDMGTILTSGLCRALLKRRLISTPFNIWQRYLEDVITLFEDCISDVKFSLLANKLSIPGRQPESALTPVFLGTRSTRTSA
jgi:hypothetical protein